MIKFVNGIMQEGTVSIDGNDIKLITKIIDQKGNDVDKNVRTHLFMDPEGVCIHNTGNKTATALNHFTYFSTVEASNNKYLGAHLFIDNNTIVQVLPINEVAWHAGDGYNGKGNRKYIAIEICDKGNNLLNEKIAQVLTADILFQIDRTSVKKHQDFSGKYCPRVILSNNRWDDFTKSVKGILGSYNIPEWKLKGIDYLSRNGFLDKPTWIDKLEEPLPAWAVFEILKDVHKDLK